MAGNLYDARDLHKLMFETGVCIGLSLFEQRFQTRGPAPARIAIAPFTTIHAAAELSLPGCTVRHVQAAVETHFLRMSGRAGEEERRIGFAVRPSLGLGEQF
jgi:hypothetical protein